MDVSLVERMNLQEMEVVRMLLVRAGLETNPGPVSRMYLVHKPFISDPAPPINIQFDDGALHGDFSIISSYSRVFRELLTVATTGCNDCKVIHLPGFSVTTMAHLLQLLTSGETSVTTAEKERVVDLKVALSCSGVSKQEPVQMESGQCKHCLRYAPVTAPTPTYIPNSTTTSDHTSTILVLFCRVYKGTVGLQGHLNKSKRCKKKEARSKTNCRCKKQEVWIVPARETKSAWDCDYVSKEMFVEALGLQLIGELQDDDDHLTHTVEDAQSGENPLEDEEPPMDEYEEQVNGNENCNVH